MSNSKKFLIWGVIILAVIFLLYLLVQQFSQPEIKNRDSRGTSIVAFGDSLVQGVGASAGHDFVSLLSTKIKQPIINLGVSGNTTADGLARINQVLEAKPKLVILLLGGNDYLKRLPASQTFQNLEQIVNQIQQAGAMVLLLGIRGGLLTDNYDDEFAALARSQQTAFVPNVLDGLLGDDRYISDTIHPNNAGYQKIADKIEPVLKDLLE
ncbi:MAG: GDSL-type esterase/lipase family protein [Patescibacteria group bacterium]